MLKAGRNDIPTASVFDKRHAPRLLFVSKGAGPEAAIPRVMHQHDERFEALFIARGSGIYAIDGRVYAVQQGDILLFNAGVIHDECPHISEDLLIYGCGAHGIALTGLKPDQLTDRAQVAVMPSGEYYASVLQLYEMLWFHQHHKGIHYREIANSLLNALLLQYLAIWQGGHCGMNPAEATLGQRIKDFIDEHYREDIELETITRALNVNRFYLAHVFKAFSGYSPKQYLIRRRIGEAQSLLLSTDYGVTHVASLVGYDNVNNFHRIFSRLVGMSPVKYKKFWLSGGVRSPHSNRQ